MRRDVKQDMMELWRETFHDSMAYIRLVFDTYYNKEYTAVRYEDNGALAASLLGVPYRFAGDAKGCLSPCGDMDSANGKTSLRGLYLCGLATRPEYRRRGYMSALMHEIEQRAAGEGFEFTFLIPADEDLAAYYRRRGYVDICRESFDVPAQRNMQVDVPTTACVNSVRSEDAVKPLQVRVVSRSGADESLCEEIRRLVNECALDGRTACLRQQYSMDDMRAIIDENTFSNGRIYLCFEHEEWLVGVAFLMPQDDEEGEVKVAVQRIAGRSEEAISSLLNLILRDWEGRRVEIKSPLGMAILKDLNEKIGERREERYGMVKWLRGEWKENVRVEREEGRMRFSIGLLLD